MDITYRPYGLYAGHYDNDLQDLAKFCSKQCRSSVREKEWSFREKKILVGFRLVSNFPEIQNQKQKMEGKGMNQP